MKPVINVVTLIETPGTINFPFVLNGKLMVLGVPIFKYIRVQVFFRQ